MSFSSALSVGTLSASFVLDSAAATASIANIQGQMTSLRQSFTQNNIIKIDSSAATNSIKQTTSALDGLKKSAELIGGLAIFGVLVKGADDLKNSVVGLNASLEQSQLKFTALTGSVQTANTLMGQLETLAAHSTFGLNQITAAAGGLLAFGVNVQNIPPLLNAMQNAAAAAGGDMAANFNNLSRILGELAGGLPLTERQIRQLVTAGIPLQPLAAQLGITVTQLLDVGKTGIVTGDQLVAAFAKVYTSGNLGDFMAKQAGTFNGALALIKTNVSLAAATAFKPLFDAISSIVVKFGEFVQTATFNQWVAQVRAGVTAVMGVLRQLGDMLAPIGAAFANLFGLNTGNIGAQMEAVSKATVDVGTYNAALQGGGEAAANNKAALLGLTEQVHAADAAILGLNGQLADNQVLLDANARSIAAVKNQYDPIIKSAEQSIKDINTPTADELSRKERELALDRDRANLELSKPDTSAFDSRILGDQNALDAMPAFDSSSYDSAIAGVDAKIQSLQDSDPAAGLKNEIASIQEAIAGLNTDAFDEKINAIRDKLAEPAPDTTGITNQLTALNDQLAGGTISRGQYESQYGALSRQKQTIVTDHTTETTGLNAQLKLLESQRADQALANKETAQADRARISDLNDQVKIIQAGVKAQMDGLKDERTQAESAKKAAAKADADARKALQDDIRDETLLRKNALAPYTAALKVITDQQAVNSNLDKVAAAQRALDLAPYQIALDKAKASEDAELTPLLAKKQLLDDHKTSLTEARQQQELGKQAAEGQATALKDAAANAKLLGQNLGAAGGGLPKAALPLGGGAATGALSVGNALNQALDPSPFVQFVNSVTTTLKALTASDDWQVIFYGHHADGSPVGVKGRFDTAVTDVFDGIGKIDDGLQSWIRSHDASGMWGVLIYGKNPDGSTATAKQQLGVFFGGINDFITTWLGDNGPKWLTSWTALGVQLGRAWDGIAGFSKDSMAAALSAIGTSLDGWLSSNTPKWLTSWTQLGSDLDKAWDGPTGFNWTSVGTFFTGIATGIDAFATDHFPGWLTSWQGLVTGLGNAFSGLGDVIAGYLSGPKQVIGSFFNALGSGVHWLAQHFPGVKDVPDFVDSSGGGASNPVLGPPLPGHAAGINNAASGHWAVVGEKGPEPMWVPQGSTIVPNDKAKTLGMLPGHADGLNFDFLGDALGAIKSFVTGSAEKAVGAIMGKIGTPDLGIIPGLGGALADMGKNALLGFLKPQEVAQNLGRASANFGGGISGGGDLIAAILGATSNPAEEMAMLFGAFIESGGRNIAQQGGGPGAGYWQIEAGPGGQYAGQVDPYNAAAAARFMLGDYDAAMGYFDPNNLESSLAQVVYHAERPAAFYGGDQLDGAWGAIQQYLVAGGGIKSPSAAGPFQGGGFPDVLSDAQSHLGEMFHAGHEWNLWCEQFAELAGEDVGYPHLGWGSALEHAQGVTLNSGIGPPGSTMLWGDGYYSLGHAAISTGDGSVIGTSSRGISQYDMSGANDYRGWAPPGLKDGAYVTSPTLAMIGEGKDDEIVAPLPMLREVVRQNAGGMTINVASGAISVVAPAGVPGQQYGRDFGAGLLDAWRAAGHN